MIRQFFAFALALTAITTGCGGVEPNQDESTATQHEAVYTTCESRMGHRCAEGAEASCYFADGAPGMCDCGGAIGTWYCERQ